MAQAVGEEGWFAVKNLILDLLRRSGVDLDTVTVVVSPEEPPPKS